MRKLNKIAALALSLVTATALIAGCGKSDAAVTTDTTSPLMNVNNQDVPFSVGEFYAYNEQASYEAYYLANGYSIDWNSDYDDSMSVEDLVKSEVLERIKMFYIVSQYAKDNGVTLTEDDQAEIDEFITTYLNGNQKVIDATKVTKESLRDIYELESYYNKGCDIIFKDETFSVSDEDIRQTDVFAVEISPDVSDFPEDTANAILARVKAGEDISKVANAYGFEAVEGNVGKGDFDREIVETTCLALSTGEATIVESDGVYLVLYCVSDYDEEATKVVKDDMISKLKSDKLKEFYDEYTKDMTITVNDNLWATIKFTTSIFTEDDVEDILNGNYANEETTDSLTNELD